MYCCAVLCMSVLCCAVLCCAVLYCAVLYCTVPYCTVPYCTVCARVPDCMAKASCVHVKRYSQFQSKPAMSVYVRNLSTEACYSQCLHFEACGREFLKPSVCRLQTSWSKDVGFGGFVLGLGFGHVWPALTQNISQCAFWHELNVMQNKHAHIAAIHHN